MHCDGECGRLGVVCTVQKTTSAGQRRWVIAQVFAGESLEVSECCEGVGDVDVRGGDGDGRHLDFTQTRVSMCLSGACAEVVQDA